MPRQCPDFNIPAELLTIPLRPAEELCTLHPARDGVQGSLAVSNSELRPSNQEHFRCSRGLMQGVKLNHDLYFLIWYSSSQLVIGV